MGPYNNPQETYNYYYLPFCKPKGRDKPGHKWGGLGEVLQGNELIDSQLDIKYKSEPPCSSLKAALQAFGFSDCSDRGCHVSK